MFFCSKVVNNIPTARISAQLRPLHQREFPQQTPPVEFLNAHARGFSIKFCTPPGYIPDPHLQLIDDFVLRLGVRRRFLGFVITTTTTIPHILLMLSTTHVRNLYDLPTGTKLTHPLCILTVRLLRRFCLVLQLCPMQFRVGSFSSFLPLVWRTLVAPLNEIFNHPRLLMLVGDWSINITTPQSAAGEMLQFLQQQQQKVYDFFSHQSPTTASLVEISEKFLLNFTRIWFLFCKTFLLNCRPVAKNNKTWRIFYNFCLNFNAISVATLPDRRLSYAKRVRAIRRRMSKRLVREAAHRLWFH